MPVENGFGEIARNVSFTNGGSTPPAALDGHHLILHEDLRAQINALSEDRKRDPGGEAAKEYVAVSKG